jgi:hypothetical protein
MYLDLQHIRKAGRHIRKAGRHIRKAGGRPGGWTWTCSRPESWTEKK